MRTWDLVLQTTLTGAVDLQTLPLLTYTLGKRALGAAKNPNHKKLPPVTNS